jgi:hypothetical protein
MVAALQGLFPRPLGALYRAVARAFPPSFTREGERGAELAAGLGKRWRAVAERSRSRNNQPRPADREHDERLEGTPVADDVARMREQPAE